MDATEKYFILKMFYNVKVIKLDGYMKEPFFFTFCQFDP